MIYLNIICAAVILAVCLVDCSKDVKDPALTEPVVTFTSVNKCKVTGTETKLKLVVPTTEKDYKDDAKLSKQVVDNIISHVDLSPPAAYNSLPFSNMLEYQKYSALASKEYVRAWRFFDEKHFEEYLESVSEIFGIIHDGILLMALDYMDDKVLEERERLILRKVKIYFRLAGTRYIGVPFTVDYIYYKTEEANDSDIINLPKKVNTHKIVNPKQKFGSVSVSCFLNDKAMDKKYVMKPEKAIKKYAKDMGINEKSGDFTVKEEIKIQLCKDYERNMLKEPFVLCDYEKKFRNIKGKYYTFSWMQTYLNDKRTEFADQHRLSISKYPYEEPDYMKEKEKNNKKKAKEESESKDDESEGSGDDDEESTDDESTDEESTDEESTDEEGTDEDSTEEESTVEDSKDEERTDEDNSDSDE